MRMVAAGETPALLDFERLERGLEQGREFAGHAVVAEEVRAVRGDFEF